MKKLTGIVLLAAPSAFAQSEPFRAKPYLQLGDNALNPSELSVLYNPEQETQPAGWQTFTDKFVSHTNSFTVVDVKGKPLTIKQIAANSDELDRFVITQ
jgi:hypothetical protein